MSALASKADISLREARVRYAPKAAIRRRIEATSAIVRTTDASPTLRHVRKVRSVEPATKFRRSGLNGTKATLLTLNRIVGLSRFVNGNVRPVRDG